MSGYDPPDLVEVRGLRCMGTHGVTEEERARAQPFVVGIEVAADLTGVGAADRLDATIDYGTLCGIARQVIEGEACALIETLAERIAAQVCTVLAAAPVWAPSCTVTVRKAEPPIPGLESAALRVRRAVVRRAFVGLGANLGDRHAALASAVGGLPGVARTSRVYETEPVGGPPGQPPYLNLVVELATAMHPGELLATCLALEAAAGRDRAAEPERWGPRALDVDVLTVGNLRIAAGDLTVPHPRMWERRFALAPLAELAPDLVSEAQLGAAAGGVRVVGTL